MLSFLVRCSVSQVLVPGSFVVFSHSRCRLFVLCVFCWLVGVGCRVSRVRGRLRARVWLSSSRWCGARWWFPLFRAVAAWSARARC